MGLPVVHYDRKGQLPRDIKLPGENIELNLFGRTVVVILEPYLPHRHAFFVRQKGEKILLFKSARRGYLLRLHADSSINEGIFFGKRERNAGRFKVGRTVYHSANPLAFKTDKHLIAVAVKGGRIIMRVRIKNFSRHSRHICHILKITSRRKIHTRHGIPCIRRSWKRPQRGRAC